jgi:hypothetical protein
MARRLPGIRFEAPPSAVADALPRMDIAAFVGFAAAGPLHTPVPIEDPAQLAAIFGPDPTLAWDERRGEWLGAQLGPAVRAFLRNGGRRCWVVRVADGATAQPNTVPLPGVLRAELGPDGPMLRPALAWARSEGSWADSLRLSTGLVVEARPLTALGPDSAPGRLRLEAAGELSIGDLLRLRYPEAGQIAFVAVDRATPADPRPDGRSGRGARRPAAVHGGPAIWFARHRLPSGDDAAPSAVWRASWARGVEQRRIDGVAVRPLDAETVQLELPLGLAGAPPVGSMVLLEPEPPSTGDRLWMIAGVAAPGGPDVVRLSGPALVWLAAPASLPAGLPLCERVSLELRAVGVDAGGAGAAGPPVEHRIERLDFVPGAPRYWAALPTDAELFAAGGAAEPTFARGLGADGGLLARERREAHAALWREASAPRFPLAGSDPRRGPDEIAASAAAERDDAGLRGFSLPLALGGLPDLLGAAAQPDGEARERDGLASFSSGLFLDDALAESLTGELIGQADDIRYIAPLTRALRGVHAVLGLDEVTLLAAPDALHRPWRRRRRPPPADPVPLPPLTRPEWWRFRGCDPLVEATAEPAWGNFLDCAIRTVAAPTLVLLGVEADGTVRLDWSGGGEGRPAWYVVEEAREPDFRDGYVVREGEATALTLYGRSPGDYYYHVRAVVGPNGSDWSDGVVARVGPAEGWEVTPPSEPAAPATELLAVQRAMLRLCAARGDLFALLSLPEHCREDGAIEHAGALEASLGFGERSAASYGALYHPWLIAREPDGRLVRTPPDGPIGGTVARRSLARGAWIAPANERLEGAVALTPPIDRARWLELQEARVNLLRQEPHGFVTLGTDTLSADPELRPINVRRLLQLLRRLALRLGGGFVFEPNDDAFERRVRRDVESALGDMFARGAFAGATPDRSFQVAFRSTPRDVEAGRFIVDLRVAPALPMDFLVVRLIQVGDRTSVTEGR